MTSTASEPTLQVRFRRGDQWVHGRVCSVSVDGLFVATTTPGRVGAIVDIEFRMPDSDARRQTNLSRSELVLTAVIVAARLPTGDAPPGFSAHLRFRDRLQRRTLVQMLEATRRVAALTPPPRRRQRRFPINWPIMIKDDRQRSRMRVLDISRSGMFVTTVGALPPRRRRVELCLRPFDDGTPIRAVAAVARVISSSVAARRLLERGLGLQLCELSSRSQQAFHRLVAGVACRAEKHIAVSASTTRAPLISAELRNVGFAVTVVTDGQGLFALCNDEHTKPDAVLFDGSFANMYPRMVDTARRQLSARGIPATHFDAPLVGPARGLVTAVLSAADKGWGEAIRPLP